jgi:hypothetical protein
MSVWNTCLTMSMTMLFTASIARAHDDNSVAAGSTVITGTATAVPVADGNITVIGSVAGQPAASATGAAVITGTATAVPVAEGSTGAITIIGNIVGQPTAAGGDRHVVMTMRNDYWLGVMASRPTPALQAQLKLPKDQGIVVENVEPHSPAMKAGIQQYDILLKGNDKPLTGLHDLFQLTNEVKEGKLKLELLRAGKHETVTASPEKRPATPMQIGVLRAPEGGVADWNPNPSHTENGDVHFRVIGPGQILPPAAAVGPAAIESAELNLYIKTKLADGSNVEIRREGKGPAKIKVTRDKEKWEATADDLSAIPESIRPDVKKLLSTAFDHNFIYQVQGAGPNNMTFSGPVGPGMPGNAALGQAAGNFFVGRAIGGAPVAGFGGPGAPGMPGPAVIGGGPVNFTGPLPGPVAFAVAPGVEQRLAEMQKQIDELRQKVEVLQTKSVKKTKTAPKSEPKSAEKPE